MVLITVGSDRDQSNTREGRLKSKAEVLSNRLTLLKKQKYVSAASVLDTEKDTVEHSTVKTHFSIMNIVIDE